MERKKVLDYFNCFVKVNISDKNCKLLHDIIFNGKEINDSSFDELNDPEFYNYLALHFGLKGDLEKKEQFLLKGIEVCSNDGNDGNDCIKSILFNNLGSLYLGIQEYQKAEQFLLKSLEYGCKIALTHLGFLYSTLADFRNALRYYLMEYDYRDDNNKKLVLYNIGITYLNLQDTENALKYFLIASELNHVYAIFWIGVCYNRMHDYKKAEIYLLKALEIDIDIENKDEISKSLKIFYSNNPDIYFERICNDQEQIKLLKEQIKLCKIENTKLQTMIDYQPGGDGYQETIENFEKSVKKGFV